jgi:FMN phosphatase YigB (HAD superfamily)
LPVPYLLTLFQILIAFRSGGELNEREERARLQRSEVRVVSFDLDNTLWNTAATISAANDGLAAFLDEHSIVQPRRVEQIMGDLFKSKKERYCPVDTESAKGPTLLTLLRKDALGVVLQEHNGYSESDAADFVEKAFAVWTTSRYKAIPLNFASSVLASLEHIASIRSSAGHPVLIGAITDGNSDPREIEELSGFFDFCANAETVGISKPDKRVYMHAAKHVMSHPSMQDMLSSYPVGSLTDDKMEDVIGPWWVHIGDDFVKDIVASKSLNMRTIWARELVMDKLVANENKREVRSEESVEDFVKKLSELKVVKMELGADDYLANGLQTEFADASVDRFDDLGSVLHKWHDDALQATSSSSFDNNKNADDTFTPLDSESILEVMMPDKPTTKDASAPVARDSKFCVSCGVKAPFTAKFCPSCGEKQPAL